MELYGAATVTWHWNLSQASTGINKNSSLAVGLENAQFMSIRQVSLRRGTYMARRYCARWNSTTAAAAGGASSVLLQILQHSVVINRSIIIFFIYILKVWNIEKLSK